MKYHNNNQIITKNVMTNGGKIIRKHFLLGNGLHEVHISKDYMGRDRINRINKHHNTVSRSAPKRMSSRDVMSSIGNSLSGMNLKQRGRGITRF